MTDKPKSRRGFASLSPEKLREISAKGGAAVPDEKRAFSKDPNLAKVAAEMGARMKKAARGNPA